MGRSPALSPAMAVAGRPKRPNGKPGPGPVGFRGLLAVGPMMMTAGSTGAGSMPAKLMNRRFRPLTTDVVASPQVENAGVAAGEGLLLMSHPAGAAPLRREIWGGWPAVTREPGCAGRCRARVCGSLPADVTARARAAWESVAAGVRWRRFSLAR